MTMTMRDAPVVYLEIDPEKRVIDINNVPCPLCDTGTLALIKHDTVCRDYLCYGTNNVCGRRMCYTLP